MDHSRSKMLSVALSMCHNRDDAEDLVQDTLVKWHQNPPKVASPEYWWRKIMKSIWLSRQRRAAMITSKLQPADETTEVHPGNTVPGMIDIRRAIGQLDVRDRQSITLKALGYSGQEMSALLGCAPTTARARLGVARKNIQAILSNSH